MANEKMTIVKAMEYIENAYGNELPVDVLEKVRGIKAQAQKKSKAERLPSESVVENAKLRAVMLESMESGKAYTCSQVADKHGISVHKAAALLGQLVREGSVLREEVKRKAYFRKA